MPEAPDFDPAQLASHAAWLRQLARRLVRDAALAEDVAQETLRVALERAPAAASPDRLRAWLHNVARNLARMQRRGDERRAARDRAHAQRAPRHAPAAADVVARAAAQRRLIDAVLALDEPYRTAVLLAYEERAKPGEIARRTGVSPEAARKRVSRGLALLRSRLAMDGRDERPNWLAGLALVAAAPPLHIAPSLTLLSMSTKSAVSAVAGAALLFLGIIAFDRRRAEPVDPDVAPGRTADAAMVTDARDVSSDSSASQERSSVPVGDAGVARALRILRGRVLLSDERTPLEGATVRAARLSGGIAGDPVGEVLATSDPSGEFRVELRGSDAAAVDAGGLWVEHPDAFDVHVARDVVATIGAGSLEVRTVAEGEVLVRVRTSAGAPVPEQRVLCAFTPVIGSEPQRWRHHGSRRVGVTDAEGQLLVRDLPVATELVFSLNENMVGGGRCVIDPATRRAEVALAPVEWASLTARIELPGGIPASGVLVRWHGSPFVADDAQQFARSDEAGRLVLTGLGAGPGELHVEFDEESTRGFHAPVPARLERGATSDLGTLVLEPSAQVAGRVLAGGAGGELTGDLTIGVFRGGDLVAHARPGTGGRFVVASPTGRVLVGAYEGLRGDPNDGFRGIARAEVVVDAPDADVELQLVAAHATLVGRIDEPLEGLSLRLYEAEPGITFGTPHSRTGTTDESVSSGVFRFVGLDPGPGRAFLTAPDGRGADLGDVVLVAGEVLDLGPVVFRAGRLDVRVTDLPPGTTATVVVMDGARRESSATCGEDGRCAIELPVGCYGVRAESPGRASAGWHVGWVRATPSPELVIPLVEPASLAGVVLGPDGPRPDAAVYLQRTRPPSNTRSAATTDGDGRFEIQGLEPGRYRYDIAGAVMGHAELAAGERRALETLVDHAPTRVVLEHGGERASSVTRLMVSSPPLTEWRRGEARGAATFDVALPAGPLVFELELGGSALALVPSAPASGPQLVLALPAAGVELHLIGAAAHRPNPRVFLESLAGAPAESTWTSRPELRWEADAGPRTDGARIVRLPYLAPGAVVVLQGVGGDLTERTQRVTVGAEGWTRAVWE